MAIPKEEFQAYGGPDDIEAIAFEDGGISRFVVSNRVVRTLSRVFVRNAENDLVELFMGPDGLAVYMPYVNTVEIDGNFSTIKGNNGHVYYAIGNTITPPLIVNLGAYIFPGDFIILGLVISVDVASVVTMSVTVGTIAKFYVPAGVSFNVPCSNMGIDIGDQLHKLQFSADNALNMGVTLVGTI